MAKTNALTEWLGIPPDEQPPNHYRLLGVKVFTSDRGRIDAAAEKAIGRARQRAGEKNKAVGEKLIGMIESARSCLLNADRKSAYDAKLGGSKRKAASPGDAIPEPMELDQMIKADESSPGSRPRKKSPSMLLPILGGTIVPVLIYVFFFSGWFGGEKNEDGRPNAEQQVNNDGESKSPKRGGKSQPSPGNNTKVAVKTQGPETGLATKSADTKTSSQVKVAGKQPATGDNKKRAKVEPGKTVPTSVENAASVDLLKKIELKRDAISGKWSIENGALLSGGGKYSRLNFANPVPKEYELHLTVTRTGTLRQASWFAMGLIGGGRPFSVYLDYNRGWTSGLSQIDGKPYTENETTLRAGNAPRLKIGIESQIVCRVEGQTVKIAVDGKPIVDWKGDFSRLTPHPNFKPESSNELAIGSYGPIKISKIELRPLKPIQIAAKTKTAAPPICKTLAAKQRPVGLMKGLVAFPAPPGSGRIGANGFYLAEPEIALAKGTAFSFRYRRAGHARGVDVIHPFGDGHVVVKIYSRSALLYAGGIWQAYRPRSVHPVKKESGHDATFPLDQNKPDVSILSILRPDGSYILKIDGKPILTAQIQQADGLSLSEWFAGKKVPLKWPTGSCGMIVGPQDKGYNIASDIRLTSAKAWTHSGLAVVNPKLSESGRLAIPDVASQKKAERLIRELFKEDFAKAKRTSEKLKLARKLLEQGQTTDDDPAARYVLLEMAKKFALDAGDAALTLNVVDATTRHYNLDPFAERLKVLRKLAASVRGIAKGKPVATAAFENAKYALEAEQFQKSLDFIKLARSTATKFRQRRLETEIGALRTSILSLKQWHDDAADASQALALNPDDPEANLVKGQFLCYIKQDWAAGLPLLAKCDDAGVKAAAQLDSAGPPDGKAMSAVGDAWRKLGEAQQKDSFEKSQWLARAAHWYRKAIPDLTGLQKTLIEKRIKEIAVAEAVPVGRVRGKSPSNGSRKSKTGKKEGRYAVAIWEISAFDRQTNRFTFYSDGKTDKGQKWAIDGKKFSFGYDSGGDLTPSGLFAVGKWQNGGVYTARMLMKNAELKSAPAKKFELSKTHGESSFGSTPSGSLDETAVDSWELTATTRGAKKFIRLSLDFTADHQVLDGNRRAGDWSIDKRRTVVRFTDDSFGEVSFGLRNRNEFFTRTKSKDGERWDCTLRRIQKVAVFKSDTRGTVTFYSNGRVNSPRAEKGTGYFWTLKPDSSKRLKLNFAAFSTTLSADGRSFSGRGPYGARIKAALVSGSLRRTGRKK